MRVTATLLLLFIAIIAFTALQQRDLGHTLQRMKAQAAARPEPPSNDETPVPTARKAAPNKPITCYFCGGQRRVQYAQDSRGQHTRMYTCPVCAGKGSNELKNRPADAAICSSCQGMARLPKPADSRPDKMVRYNAQPCVACGSRGWVP